jgi:spore coat polysaccharide biosynthesis protein SpsF
MGSTRFPGKVMSMILGKPNLQRIVERVKQARKIDHIVVATSTSFGDYEIVQFCKNELGVFAYRGSENDVLNRVYKAAETVQATHVVDITADCPLVDPRHIDFLIKQIIRKKLDYISNIVERCFPDGFDVQVYTMKILEQLNFLVSNKTHRSHTGWNVLQYIKQLEFSLGRKIKIGFLKPSKKYWFPDWGLTLDELADKEVLENIFFHFKNNSFSAIDVIEYLLKNPDILKINKNVKRKEPGTG